MFEWLWQADTGLLLGALGFISGIASLIYARSQARGTHAQLKSAKAQADEALRAAELVAEGARQQAIEALRAAALVAENAKEQAVEALRAASLVAEGAKEQATQALRAAALVANDARSQASEALRAAALVAEGAKEQALEALRAAELVAESARQQALEALRAAGLVAESSKEQATQALRAAELLAESEVSARVREMRARNFRANPQLPAGILAIIEATGGPDAYSVMLDSMDIAQEIYVLRKRGLVSDENWRRWMNDQMVLISRSPTFQDIFRREADQGVLLPEFVEAFQPVFEGRRIADPAKDQRAAAERSGTVQVTPGLAPTT